MRKLFLCPLLVVTSLASAQEVYNTSIFNNERNRITRNGMVVLGAWSAANIIYSGIATGQTTGTNKYFHQMNVMWGGINLGLAALGYVGTRKKKSLNMEQSLKQQAGIEKTYLFNLGLDVAYVASGLYLKERSKNTIENRAKFKGYGESIMMQGAALFVLDAVMFAVHNRHGKKLYGLLGKTDLGATPSGIGLIVRL